MADHENSGQPRNDGNPTQSSSELMTYGQLAALLKEEGFGAEAVKKALGAARKSLLNKGASENEALQNINADVRRKGRIYTYLEKHQPAETPGGGHPSAGQSGQEAASDGICPKCGAPREPGQIECRSCGVIFSKISAAAARTELPASDPASSAGGGAGEELARKKGIQGIQGFFARHKVKLAMAAGVVLAVLILAEAGQWYFSGKFEKAEAAFTQSLSMNARSEFEASLKSLYHFLDVAADTVSKHGWSREEVTDFCDRIREGRERFLAEMKEKARGGDSLYGYPCKRVSASLCSGLRYVVGNIEDKSARKTIHYAYQIGGVLPFEGCDPSLFLKAKKQMMRPEAAGSAGRQKTEEGRPARDNRGLSPQERRQLNEERYRRFQEEQRRAIQELEQS
jgi:hypothetical protein